MIDRRKIYWLDINRFDVKPDKSTWLEMGDSLSRHGFDVTIVTSYANGPYVPISQNVNVLSLRGTDLPAAFKIWLLARMALRLIRIRDKDAIYVVPTAALIIAPILRAFGMRNIHLDIRTVPVTVHGGKKRLDTYLFWSMPLRRLANQASSFSFITDRLRKQVERVSGQRFTDACIWSSGVRTCRFEVSRSVSDLSTYRFFYHGTITRDRGILSAIDAFGNLFRELGDKVHLTIVGSGPDIGMARDFAATEGLDGHVRFTGLVSYDEVPAYLGAADCCLCPLPDRPEWEVSSPLKIFEYMAAEKPIIATPIAAHREILDGEQFVIWSSGFDSAALTAAMRAAYLDRESLARAARRDAAVRAKAHDWDAIAVKFARYLQAKYI